MTKEQAQDAHYIQNCACNPHGVVRSLCDSIDTDFKESGFSHEKTSAATRLILHHLIWILTRHDVTIGPMWTESADGWKHDTREVEKVLQP